jgi:threonylcarbamoyladenosine tRNA methylthiotransferase MtaB
VFTYSERPGTPAAEAATQVPIPVRKARTRALRDLAARKNLDFRRSMVGKTLSVVTLDNGGALSDNYLKVTLATPLPANLIDEIRIGGLTNDGVCELGALPMFTSLGDSLAISRS